MADLKINGIWGAEPMREGEFPDCHMVGRNGVTHIDRREENLGTYGLVWFDVFADDVLRWSLNASFVASIRYDPAP